MEIGVVIRPELPPEELPRLAVAAEAAGVGQLWVWEDCFLLGGTATATVVLARTERLQVGIGLYPVPLRNPAATAMEIATLARLFPGRLLPALGHGVLGWMAQVGARSASPMTLLAEYTDAVRGLLAGREVTSTGRYVKLDRVKLIHPPLEVPPLLVGARGRKTLHLAGAHGDGVLLDLGLSPDQVRSALAAVNSGQPDWNFRRIGYVSAPEPANIDEVTRLYGDVGLDTLVLVPPATSLDPQPWFSAAAAGSPRGN